MKIENKKQARVKGATFVLLMFIIIGGVFN